MELLDNQFLGNSLEQWLLAILVAFVTLLVLWITKRVVISRFHFITRRTSPKIENLVTEVARSTKFPILVALSLYAGSLLLTFEPLIRQWIGSIAIIIFLLQLGFWADKGIRVWLSQYSEENLEDQAGNVTTMRALAFVLRLTIFSILLLIGLDNIPGVEITALIASLGIGGIAVALAVQNILGDLFASLSISLDKPFVIGDFIVVDDDTYRGQVEEIGLKTTRLRSLSGEQLIFSNSDLLNSRIRNFKRMEERRVSLTIGVSYETPVEKLRAIPQFIAEILTSMEEVRFDRAHFASMGDFSLNYEVVYFLNRPAIELHMDTLHAFNLAIVEKFATEGIEFPFPTQTVLLNQVPRITVATTSADAEPSSAGNGQRT